ncbi:MAG: staygreen family protein [Clostridium sp.]|uniref:staygreen family protein n=1 Tax=Clostridium sp. TaxID=1506 RepID=UPI0029120226|nr:staygreen family protein [Clostridium sp.]MDU7149882.1 staygreen family protein [Clostridium sp.]
MNKLDPNKLIIDFKKGISQDGPISPRNYTVTHSYDTGDILITVAKDYNKDHVTDKRDEVYGRWCENGKNYVLCLYLNVDGNERDKNKVLQRNRIFRDALPLIITAIRQADLGLIKKHTKLNESDIFVKFNSRFDEFYKVENWGKLKNYKYIEDDCDEYELKSPEEGGLIEQTRSAILRKKKFKISMEEGVILNLLNPYIENQLCIAYGSNIRYYIEKCEIIDIDEIKSLDACGKIYEVSLVVKVKIKSKIREVAMDFIIKPNGVIIKRTEE